MDKTVFIRFEAVPLNQDIESGDGVSQTSLEILPGPMSDTFEMADCRQHGYDRFDNHPHIPRAALADFHVFRITLFSERLKSHVWANRRTINRIIAM
jgi:hypothetical protein